MMKDGRLFQDLIPERHFSIPFSSFALP